MGKNNKTQFGMLVGMMCISLVCPFESTQEIRKLVNKHFENTSAPKQEIEAVTRHAYALGQKTEIGSIDFNKALTGKELENAKYFDDTNGFGARVLGFDITTTMTMAASAVGLIGLVVSAWFLPNAWNKVNGFITSLVGSKAVQLGVCGLFLYTGINSVIVKWSK